MVTLTDVSNLSDTIIPKSDQLNAEQLITGPVTIKITDVKRGTVDQPVTVHYEGEEGRPYKPCKSMRKVMIFAWGEDGRDWVGKSLTLYNDPDVKWAGVKVGGIRVSHMSDIKSDIKLMLSVTKGKREETLIKKLITISDEEILKEAAENGTQALITAWKNLSGTARKNLGGNCPQRYKDMATRVDSEATDPEVGMQDGSDAGPLEMEEDRSELD